MLTRPRFLLERWIQKGALHQLLLMAALIALVALLGGLAAWAATPRFASLPEATWWAFLRLTDPGYLGDDEGVSLRAISTGITVLGYVIFMGSLIAIMSQWLARTMRQLERGLTPISMRDHVLVLGWTNRTPEIVLQLLSARGRLERFLARRDAGKLRVVVQLDEVSAERRLELREYLGAHWNESQVFLRSGSSLQPEHLRRLDLGRASAVLVPGADFELGGAETNDTRVVKTLLTVGGLLRASGEDERPHVVAEVFDPFKVPLASRAVDGKVHVIAGDRVISRLISQCVRHRGLAQVLLGILSHRRGNSIYLRAFPELAGAAPHSLYELFPRAVVLGYVRVEGGTTTADLDPCTGAALREDDLLVLLAESYDACAPLADTPPAAGAAHEPGPVPVQSDVRGDVRRGVRATTGPDRRHRILALGWSHKLRALVLELGQSHSRSFELTVMSRVRVEERQRWLGRVGSLDQRVRIQHLEGDYALETDLAEVDVESFDSVVFLASDFESSSEEADARTILGCVLLRSHLAGRPDAPEMLVELLHPQNAHLFPSSQDVYVVTPQLLSYLIAHVALRPELNEVFDELFCAGGSEVELQPVERFGLARREASFLEVQRAALERGAVALGILDAAGEHELNPDREKRWSFEGAEHVVVLVGDGA